MTKQDLIDALNEDLAGELMAITQYVDYSAKAMGPHRPQLKQFFQNEIQDELMHAQFLAEKIVALGGEPTSKAREVPAAPTNKDMLEEVLTAEKQAIEDYSRRAKQASEYGDVGLQVRLEDIVADETNHAEETERLLREWTDH